MYDQPNTPASRLRARAETSRTLAPASSSGRIAPIEQGERLATVSRGDSEELRFSWSEYNGRPFLNIRLWNRDVSGQWWPTKDKGIAIRRHELADLAEAVAGAMDRADAFAKTQGGAR